MRKLFVYACLMSLVLSSRVSGHEGGIVFVTCVPSKVTIGKTVKKRELILDTDTARLDITSFTTGEWQRGILFQNGVENITFKVFGTDYYEGWAINRESLKAVFRLEVVQKPDAEEELTPVVRILDCTKEERETKNQI